MPDESSPDTVIILAPLNCPSAAAQRARALSEELTRRGIPNRQSASYSADYGGALTADQKSRLDWAVRVMRAEIPAVFINGRAKANPTSDEVATEYRVAR